MFVENPMGIELLLDASRKYRINLVGVWFSSAPADFDHGKSEYIFRSADDLLQQVDVAIVFAGREHYFDLSAKVLRKGINLFLANLPEYSHSALLELNQLALEIGVPVGFGCAGSNLIRPGEIISNYFILQLTRDAVPQTDDETFRRMLIHDLASFVRIKPCGMKKIRVNGLPLFTKHPKAINLRLEYDNSSVITSSLTRVNSQPKCALRFFSGNDGYFKDTPPYLQAFSPLTTSNPGLLMNDKHFMESLADYIKTTEAGLQPHFGIEHAIETLSLAESIEDRLYPMN